MEFYPEIIQKTIEDKLYYDNNLMVDIEINYPQISGFASTPGEKNFNRYYLMVANRIHAYGRVNLYRDAVAQYKYSQANGFPFFKYDLLNVFETTYNKYNLISLYMEEYQYTGGAHGNTVRTGDTWDLLKARRLSLGELFLPRYDWRKVILDEVTRQALEIEASGDSPYFDDVEKNIVTYFDPKNFYLTYEGLAVYYPLYTIAPYASGILVFIIPYEIFNGHLRYPQLLMKNE